MNNYYITTTKQLECVYRKILKSNNKKLAIDTEFLRKRTYYPILCLIQIAFYDCNNELESYIIDPLSKDIDLKKFYDLLANGKVKKIFHSMIQDYDALYFLNKNMKLVNFDDTQIMSEFCGLNYNLGYVDVIKEALGISIEKDKEIQISNWNARPLTQKQKAYALNDVKYLIGVYDEFLSRLIKCNNYDFYLDEIAHIKKIKNVNYIINNAWKRLRIELHKRPLYVVKIIKKICEWREKIAIKENVIKNIILDDEIICDIATLIEEGKVDYVKKINKIKKKYKNDILNIININLSQKNKKTLFYSKDSGFPKKEKLNSIYSTVHDFSQERNIEISKILTKFDIISVLMGYSPRKTVLYGWKNKYFSSFLK